MAHIVTCSSNQKCNEEKLSLTSPAEQAPEEEVTPDKKAAPPIPCPNLQGSCCTSGTLQGPLNS